MVATNGIGWEIQEFKMPKGWLRSTKFPDVYTSYHEAMTVLCANEDKAHEFRVYEALKINSGIAQSAEH